MIQSYFGGIVTITINLNKKLPRYYIFGINNINNFIVRHFENYIFTKIKKKMAFDLC
jgi:hypothetical protein